MKRIIFSVLLSILLIGCSVDGSSTAVHEPLLPASDVVATASSAQTQTTDLICNVAQQQIVGITSWDESVLRLSIHVYPAAGCPKTDPVSWTVVINGTPYKSGIATSSNEDQLVFSELVDANAKIEIWLMNQKFQIGNQDMEFDFIHQAP